jgi:hypothetical protein
MGVLCNLFQIAHNIAQQLYLIEINQNEIHVATFSADHPRNNMFSWNLFNSFGDENVDKGHDFQIMY